jgi:hypothetical protein
MLHQENGTHSIDGVYERERLRSMAKKLGLRLVKRRVQRAEDTDPFVAPGNDAVANPRPDRSPDLETELDKCG